MHSVLTVLLLGATCTDSFVAMMERGSNMREMRLAKGGCYAMIFAAVNTLMLAPGMGVSSTLRSSLSLEEGRILPACFLIGLATFLLVKMLHRAKFVEHLDLGFSYRKSLRLAAETGLDTLILGAALGFLHMAPLPLMSGMFLISFAAIFAALWIGYYLGAAYQRIMIVGTSMVYYATTLFLLLPA